MDELFLYDRDSGLFKSILKKSTVIEGRYYLVDSGFDINSAEPGAQLDEQKYPCAICAVPRSQIVPPDFIDEPFTFVMYFLTRHGHTGQGGIKDVDADTLTSKHPSWYDWQDMKKCAAGFMRMLSLVARKVVDSDGRRLIGLDKQNVYIERITKKGTDVVNGVKLSFPLLLKGSCENLDYASVSPGDIEIPSLSVHPLHKL